MNLKTIACPSCGGMVEVDEYSKSFTCNFCGYTTIIEKERNSYADGCIEKAELFIRNQQDYSSAKSQFEYASSSDSADPRPWLGLLRCETRDFQKKLYVPVPDYEPLWFDGFEQRVQKYYDQYVNLESKQEMLQTVRTYFEQYMYNNKHEFEELCKNATNKDDLEKEYISDNGEKGNYNETIKAENKIISSEALRNILVHMDKKLKKYKAIGKVEDEYNQHLGYGEKEFTFEDSNSSFKFDVDFYDNTNIAIDNFDEFINVFDSRLDEIKRFDANLYLSYSVKEPEPNKRNDSYYQHINLYIREDKMDIDVKLSSEDDKLSDIYALIKRTVIEAPIKYDEIIKKRGFINLVVSMGTGLIPAIILVSLLLTVEEVREIFMTTYVTYPIAVLIVGLGIGTFVSSIMLSSKYSRIEPEKKSKGWDSNGKRIYVDDTEDYISKSEILIGKNKNNLECRDYIKRTYARFKTFFLIELLIVGILSVIVVGMGMMD